MADVIDAAVLALGAIVGVAGDDADGQAPGLARFRAGLAQRAGEPAGFDAGIADGIDRIDTQAFGKDDRLGLDDAVIAGGGDGAALSPSSSALRLQHQRRGRRGLCATVARAILRS